MPPNANFLQGNLLEVVLSEYLEKSHNFTKLSFTTSLLLLAPRDNELAVAHPLLLELYPNL